MQLFIGMTFRQSQLLYQTIDKFRQKFDEKYSRSDLLQMTLMPPFKVEGMSFYDLQEFVEELSDDMDTHLAGHEQNCDVHFNGFDFLGGRKGVLFLKPTIPVDIFHAQESLKESIKQAGGVFNRHKNLGKSHFNDLQTFLPIGRFTDMNLMSLAVDKAQQNFTSPFQLQAQNITLFEKMPGMWIPRKILHTFPHGKNNDVESIEEKRAFSLAKTPVNL